MHLQGRLIGSWVSGKGQMWPSQAISIPSCSSSVHRLTFSIKLAWLPSPQPSQVHPGLLLPAGGYGWGGSLQTSLSTREFHPRELLRAQRGLTVLWPALSIRVSLALSKEERHPQQQGHHKPWLEHLINRGSLLVIHSFSDPLAICS